MRREAGTHAGPISVTQGVFGRLRGQVGRWVGLDAFDALAERSCTLARGRHPSLRALTWRGGKEPVLAGIEVPVGREEDAYTGAEALVATLVELLGRFIGDEMACRIVLDGWPAPDDPTGVREKEES